MLGVLVARAADQSFEGFLRERIFEPLRMRDTGFAVSPTDRGRFSPCYVMIPGSAERAVYDRVDGQWSQAPAFPSGGAGLVSTVEDYGAFAQMLLAGGSYDGRRIVSRPSIEAMTSDQLTPEQRAPSGPDPSGAQGWGFGVGVQLRRTGLTQSVGSYGWGGGLGSSWSNDPAEDLCAVLMTNQMWSGPTQPPVHEDFWTCVYAAIDD